MTGGEPTSGVELAGLFHWAPGDLPSSESCTIRSKLAAARGPPDVQQLTWPNPGPTGGSCLLPGSPAYFAPQESTHWVHMPQSTLRCTHHCPKQGVHLEKKSAKTLRFYLLLPLHSPASFLPRLCRAQVCGSTQWGHGTADLGVTHNPWPISEPPCRRHASSPSPTTGAGQRARRHLCEASPSLSHSNTH